MSVGWSVLADPRAIMGEIQLKNSNDQNDAVASGVTAGSSSDNGAGGGGCLGLTKGSEWRLPISVALWNDGELTSEESCTAHHRHP